MVIFLSVLHLTRWYDASLHDSKATNSRIYNKTCSMHNNTMTSCQLAKFLEVIVRCRLRELMCWIELFSVRSNGPLCLEVTSSVICQWSYFCIISGCLAHLPHLCALELAYFWDTISAVDHENMGKLTTQR